MSVIRGLAHLDPTLCKHCLKKTHHERNVPAQRILYEMLEVARSWLNERSEKL